MTKIYLIRHAEAEGNIYRRAHGHYNGLVTLKGHKQIELLRERFMEARIDAVYSSDLARAAVTATALSQPRGMDIITATALREVDLGAWEDVAWGDIEHFDYEMNVRFNHDPANWHTKGSEKFENVGARVFEFISKTAEWHDGGAIAVFSHGFAIRTFLCLLKNVPSCETEKVPYCDNTAVTLLTYESGAFSIDYAGDNAHLAGKHSTLEQQSWWRADERKKPENLRFLSLDTVAGKSLVQNFHAKAGEMARADVQYAAFLADGPIGIIGLDSIREKDKGNGWISYIYVVPQRRKNTFGTQLLGLAVSDYRKLGRDKLRIELPSGSPSVDFMRRCGFETLATTDAYCLMEKEIKNW